MGTTKRPSPRKLAGKLKRIRTRSKLSQGDIAKRLDVKDRASISLYENGQREPPLVILLAYARLAKVPMETLVDDHLDFAYEPKATAKKAAKGRRGK
jgi:transcriptional regulator with XRE-family HTH domain